MLQTKLIIKNEILKKRIMQNNQNDTKVLYHFDYLGKSIGPFSALCLQIDKVKKNLFEKLPTYIFVNLVEFIIHKYFFSQNLVNYFEN